MSSSVCDIDSKLDALKSLAFTLKTKLKEFENSSFDKDELDALPRTADAIAQCRSIENWYTSWVKQAVQGSMNYFRTNGPLFISKSKSNSILSCNDNDVLKIVSQEARAELFRKRDSLSPLPTDVQMLEELLCRNSSNWHPPSLPPSPARLLGPGESFFVVEIPPPLDYKISLVGYQRALAEFHDYVKLTRESNGYLLADSLWFLKWLTTKLFARLVKHEDGAFVQVSSIMEYVHKKLKCHQLRLELMKYDIDGNGYLTKEKLRMYLNRLWKSSAGEHNQSLSHKYFIEATLSEIFFLLDPHRANRLKIVELLGSRLHPLIRTDFWDGQFAKRFHNKLMAFQDLQDNQSTEFISTAVFSQKLPEISVKIWKNDDRVRDKRVRILQPLLQRLVNLYDASGNCKNNAGISFNTFLDITFAWEYLGTCFSSIYYFFRVLDTDDKGYLDESDLQNHYRNIEQSLIMKTRRRSYRVSPRNDEKAWITPSFMHIQAEIKDFLERESISRITPENLFKAKDGHTMISYLVNVEISINNTLGIYNSR